MINTVLLVPQILTDSEKKRNLCGQMSPADSQDTYQAISAKADVPSHGEAEEDPLKMTFPGGIKAEPEVRCVSLSMLGRFHQCRYPSFYEILLQLTAYNCKNFAKAECIQRHWAAGGQQTFPTIPVSVHMPGSSELLELTFHRTYLCYSCPARLSNSKKNF
jgi:hypothetical protein